MRIYPFNSIFIFNIGRKDNAYHERVNIFIICIVWSILMHGGRVCTFNCLIIFSQTCRVVGFMLFNTIFNNISVSFVGGGNLSIPRKPPTCRKSLKTLYH